MKNFLFEIKEGTIISLKAIFANKFRSFLTTIGIVIGVFMVVMMMNFITGIDKMFKDGTSAFGSDNLYIDKWEWFNNDIPWWELRNRKDLTMEDYEDYKSLAKLPLAIAPTSSTSQNLEYMDNVAYGVNLMGSTAEYIKTTSLDIEEGRFYTELEANSGRNVIVIGSSIKERLFGDLYALGKTVKIKGKKFKVVGILEEQGSEMMGGFNPDNLVYLPINNVFKNFKNRRGNSITINVKAPTPEEVDQVEEEAISIMRRVRGLKYDEANNFSVNKQESLLANIDQAVGVIQIGGFFITALSLVVGAIGIMNIMFVSVKERTKEIGVRKAIGAKRVTILLQFLIEAVVICLFGGFVGLFLAQLGTLLLLNYTSVPLTISTVSIYLAIFASLISGVVSGLSPAMKASKMDPVEALRYE